MKYWCEHPWRTRFDNARGEVRGKCGRPTDTAIERFRNRRSIFTPPRELQAAITNALRATGKLDDFEVDALVLTTTTRTKPPAGSSASKVESG